MSTKFLKHFNTRQTPQSEPVPGTNQVPNSAGGYAYALDDWARLERFLILGSEGGSYYASERTLTVENAKAVVRCLEADAGRTLRTIVQVSDSGRAPKNEPAVMALAIAAGTGHTAAASEALPKVCRTGTHLFAFAEAVQGLRGWGRGLRRGVAAWYEGKTPEAWDHDPPAGTKWTPFGVLMLATGALTLIFTRSRETSDFWADALKVWWRSVKDRHGHIKRLVIYLDNGPKNSGTRTQWLRRLVEFSDWSGLEIRLVYYPPYHSKYNPIERCWSALEQKWGGALLNSLKVILQQALRMSWMKMHPVVKRLEGDYAEGVRLSKKEMKPYEARLLRSKTLPKYDITIMPLASDR